MLEVLDYLNKTVGKSKWLLGKQPSVYCSRDYKRFDFALNTVSLMTVLLVRKEGTLRHSEDHGSAVLCPGSNPKSAL